MVTFSNRDCFSTSKFNSLSIQQEAFETLVTRRPEARKMNYLLEIALNRDYAKESRLFNVFDFLKKRYWKLFYTVHKEENRIRMRQFGIALIFIIISSLVSMFAFIYLVFQVRSGKLSLGIVVGFASSLVAAISASNGLVEESDLLYESFLFHQCIINVKLLCYGIKGLNISLRDLHVG